MSGLDEIKKGTFPRILISGIHGSAGKTTLTIGLLGALRSRGLSVQPFKKGPDFIDPLWHSEASGQICRNLDFYISPGTIRSTFITHSMNADITIIEGNKGLFDGMDVSGCDSTSALARHIEAPVILVVDSTKMTRGIAPLIQGYLGFEKDLNIAGIVLNKVAGSRHEEKLRSAIEYYTDVEVIGSLFKDEELEIKERHLGLVPSAGHNNSEEIIRYLTKKVEENLNLDKIIAIAGNAGRPSYAFKITKPEVKKTGRVKIAVARDEAFCFYYPENLEDLERNGAELKFFSPIHDSLLPEADAIYLGGGFPEMYMKELSQNTPVIAQIRKAAQSGMPVYAECGGLMYLARSIKSTFGIEPMTGILPLDTEMGRKPQGRGYTILETNEIKEGPWEIPGGLKINAHEFHYSRTVIDSENFHFAYKVERGYGINGKQDGIIQNNIFASYAHLHSHAAGWWAEAFVNAGLFFRKNNKTVLQNAVTVS